MVSAKKNPEDTRSNHLWLVNYGVPTGTSTLFWAILLLDLPITFGHPTAGRSPGLALSAAIPFAMKHSAPCSADLRSSALSTAAVVVHRSTLIPEALSSEVLQETRQPLFFLPPPSNPRHPVVLRTSRTSAVSRPPGAPQIPRTGSASRASSSRCSHIPSS